MKKYLFILGVAALALVSCKKEASLQTVDATADLTPIVFSSMEKAATRATVVDDADLTTLYVNATKGAGETEVFTAAEFTKSGADWKGGKYWPSEDESYHFYVANQALTYSASGATIAPANANTDIVVAYAASPTYKSKVNIELGHIFCQIGTVKILAPEGWSVSGLSITLQPKTSGTYNVKTGAWTAGAAGSAVSILPKAGSSPATVSTTEGGFAISEDNDLWLVPGTYTLTCSYTITKGDYSKTFSGATAKTCNVTLVQGKNNNIGPHVEGGVEQPNIPAPDDILEITFGVTVTDWEDIDVDAQF